MTDGLLLNETWCNFWNISRRPASGSDSSIYSSLTSRRYSSNDVAQIFRAVNEARRTLKERFICNCSFQVRVLSLLD